MRRDEEGGGGRRRDEEGQGGTKKDDEGWEKKEKDGSEGIGGVTGEKTRGKRRKEEKKNPRN
jgi:hypothetical protein